MKTILLLLFPLVLFSQPGTLDTTFDADGKKYFGFATQNDNGEFVLIQPDNKIIVGGRSSLTGGYLSFSLARLNPSGTFDNTFGTNGKVTTTYGTEGFEAVTGALQTDGKIIMAGTANINSSLGTAQVAVVRYNSNGSLDTTFDTDGIVLTSISASNEDFGKIVKVQADGKILVGVQSRIDFNRDYVLVRYNTDGSLDSTFDSDGILITNLSSAEVVYDIALQNDGKIIAVGYKSNANDDAYAVRYNADGSIDTSFGTNGFFEYDIANGHNYATAVAVATDDKIIIGGRYTNGAVSSPFVLRLNANGTFDNTFDSDGVFLQTNDESINDIILQSDNKIITIGTSNLKFGVSKLTTSGSLDTTFGANGKVETMVNTQYCMGKNGTLQPDGKLFVVGDTYGSPFMKYGVVRYNNDAPLAINQVAVKSTFSVYPNPTTGQFSIAVDDTLLGSNVFIYNSIGQKIKQFKIDALDISDNLKSGVYLVEIVNSNQRICKKIVVK